MPTYSYECATCKLYFEERLSMSEYDMPCQEPCPDCKQKTISRVLGSTKIVSGIAGITHNTSQEFRDVMTQIRKNNPGSVLRTY